MGLARRPGVGGFLSTFAISLVFLAGCDRAGQKGNADSGFLEARVDTITIRDTIVVLDTVWVDREVVKRVVVPAEVPAEVPAYYKHAWQKQVAEEYAGWADEKTCFSGLDSMEVEISMTEDAKDILSEQRAKDKFELTLRRHGVPLSDFSNPYLWLSINALWDESKTWSTYGISVKLSEALIFQRNNKPHRRIVIVWQSGGHGYAGSRVAREALLDAIEEKAEEVANLYLSAN